MKTKTTLVILMFILMANALSACNTKKIVAPEIEPPDDLVPGYVPEGYELVAGFQIDGEINLPGFEGGSESNSFGPHWRTDIFFQEKSPKGNVIQGVYYQKEDDLILVTKSYFPEATLDDWLAAYEAAQPQPCECDCECADFPRLEALPMFSRIFELQEERTIDDTSVAILKGPTGWLTIFVRGDYLLAVESKISLEEILKIVESLLEE